MMHIYPGKLAILQRVLPTYRVPFFDLLENACRDGLTLCAGDPRPEESIEVASSLGKANYTHTTNTHLLSGSIYLCWQKGLVNWLETQNPQALIVEANPRYPSTRNAIRWMKARKRPVIGWGLGAPPLTGLFSDLRRSIRRNFASQFDALITYSQRGKQEYERLGIMKDRIFVASNAVSPRPLAKMQRKPPNYDHKPCILFVGRLQARKRVDLLIEACARLPIAIQPRLAIVGDGPERENLENLAGRVYPTTEFAGALHGEKLIPYYEQADLFVLPGTGGLAIQQAMSHALPVIVAQGDGTQDDLVNPKNGWQIAPGDLDALTATLQLALGDIAKLREMGLESLRLVSEEVNLERMVEVFLEALEKVI